MVVTNEAVAKCYKDPEAGRSFRVDSNQGQAARAFVFLNHPVTGCGLPL